MGVVTNLRLVDDGGDVLSAPQLALHLSQLVRQLPWQDEVWKAVRQA